MGEQACSYAVVHCPFLKQLADREGPTFARSIARDPTRPAAVPAARGFQPLLPEAEGTELLHTFRLFHGPQGVVPLSGFEGKAQQLSVRAGKCPYGHSSATPATAAPKQAVVPIKPQGLAAPRPALPLASMNLSFGGGVSFGAAGGSRGD
jgi:hypothetical protein